MGTYFTLGVQTIGPLLSLPFIPGRSHSQWIKLFAHGLCKAHHSENFWLMAGMV